MQDDNLEKRLGSLLRQQQEENPLPYDLGAWEAFESRRAAAARRKTIGWISGIAASLTLIGLVAALSWNTINPSEKEVGSETLALQSESSSSDLLNSTAPKAEDATPTIAREQEGLIAQASENSKESAVKVRKSVTSSSNQRLQPKVNQESNSSDSKELAVPTLAQANTSLGQSTTSETLVSSANQETKEATQALAEELPKEPIFTEEEIVELLETPAKSRVALGLYPGFGSNQADGQTTSGSSLGLGVLVDMELSSKVRLGSGLAVNYLNQASQSQDYAQVAGFSSPVTQTSEITQLQVDIPIYVSYPITANKSVSIQAGFSNLMTFPQDAVSESSYTRQVAVLDGTMPASNSFTLKSEQVRLSSELPVTNGNKFYPFATANLGVNLRLYQSKKTSYEVMPFYNYPLQEFSGYGEKLGIFGASFRVSFLPSSR